MSRMFPEEVDGEPRLEILEHPKSRGFRFRYTCEGPSHGGIPGASSDKNKKTFPAVKIANYQGYARIVVQLVTNEENPRLHPHSLVGKQCQNGICTVQCGPKDMTATFPNLGIQHVTKKNVASILEERYIAAEMQLSSINDGFPQEVQRNIKDEDRKRIASKAQSEAKSIDLSVVRLMFIAYLPDSQGAFTIMLKPIISDAIFDSKAPNAATLKICRMDHNAGSASGGDEVYLLCDKVQKDDIQVRFVEEDSLGREVWENYGSFCPTDVHRQFAIVFRTPPYKDQFITHAVNVNVQLRRKSDGEVSEPRTFTYLPNKSDFDMIEKKRRKVIPGYLDHIGGGNNSQGFNFSGAATGSNSIQGSGSFHFEGSSGSSNEKKAAIPPLMLMNKKTNPQKGPVAPHILMQNFEPSKPQPSPPAVQIKQEYIANTRIPKPKPLLTQTNSSLASSSYAVSSTQFVAMSSQQTVASNKRSYSSAQVSSTDRAYPVPCPATTMIPANSASNQTTAINDMHTRFTEQFFVSPTTEIPNQVSMSNGAVTTSATPTTVPLSECNGVDVSASFVTSSCFNQYEWTEEELMEILSQNGDIEYDGCVSSNKGGKFIEQDFAAALYAEEPQNMRNPQMTSVDNSETLNSSVESDSAYSVSCDMANLSLIGSSGTRDNFVESGNQKISQQEEITRICTTEPNENLNLSFKMAEATKMASAMYDYAITGDVKALLRLQRHLTSTKDENGDTVLHLAVVYNHVDVLSSILDVVSSLENRYEILNCVNNDQQTALQIAALMNNVEAAIELLKAGASPLISDNNGNHAIHVASRHGNADMLSRLLNSTHAQTQQFDTKNYNGLGCYHLAVKAKQENEQCLQLLREHNCDVDTEDERSGRTALHMAVEMRKTNVVRCLLAQCDANVNVTTFEGYSSLHLASSIGCCEIGSLLLQYGANPQINSLYGKPIDLTSSEEMRDILTGKAKLSFDATTEKTKKQDMLFDRELRNRFSQLLNAEETGSNWNDLADRLQLSDEKPILQNSDNPTASLIEMYWTCHGSVNGLRSALMHIGRHDAVQILNRAVNCKLNQSWRKNNIEVC